MNWKDTRIRCGNIQEIRSNSAYQENIIMKDWMGIINAIRCSAKSWIGKQSMALRMTRALILAWRITKRVNSIIGQSRASRAGDSLCTFN